MTLYFLQLLKLKKIKCTHFLVMRSNDWDITIVVFKNTTYRVIEVKLTKWQYLRHLTSYLENKATLFSSTFKVEENKVFLFSWYEVKWLRYSHFFVYYNTAHGVIEVKLTKWLYLSHLTSYHENKTTLFSETLKVEEHTFCCV